MPNFGFLHPYLIYVKFSLYGILSALTNRDEKVFNLASIVFFLLIGSLLIINNLLIQNPYYPALIRFLIFIPLIYVFQKSILPIDFRSISKLLYLYIILLLFFIAAPFLKIDAIYSSPSIFEIHRFSGFGFNHIDGGILAIYFLYFVAKKCNYKYSFFQKLILMLLLLIAVFSSGSKLCVIFFIGYILILMGLVKLILTLFLVTILFTTTPLLSLVFEASPLVKDISNIIESIIKNNIKSLSLINRFYDYGLVINFLKESSFTSLLFGDTSYYSRGELPEVGFVSNLISYGIIGATYFYLVLTYFLYKYQNEQIFIISYILVLDLLVNITQSVFIIFFLLFVTRSKDRSYSNM